MKQLTDADVARYVSLFDEMCDKHSFSGVANAVFESLRSMEDDWKNLPAAAKEMVVRYYATEAMKNEKQNGC